MQDTGESFRIDLLGRFAVSHNGRPVDVSRWQRRHAQLLRMLAASPGNRLMREVVVDLLWPDSSPEAGSTNLRYAVHLIRRALPTTPPAVVLERDWISLNPAHTWVIDLARFEEAAAAASDNLGELEHTASLYGGPPLSEDTYEDWARPIQDRVAVEWRSLRFRLIRAYHAEGHLDQALLWCQSLLESDPVDEPAMQELMMLLLDAGQAADALRRYQAWKEVLWDEVGVSPAPETQAIAEGIAARAGVQDVGELNPLSVLPSAVAVRHRGRAGWWLAFLGVGALVAAAVVIGFSTRRAADTPSSLPVLDSWSAGISHLVHLESPGYVAVDRANNVYIADRSSPALQELSPRGEVLRRWQRVGRPSTVVSGITIDARGRLYIADGHCSCILKLSASGRVESIWGKRGGAPGQFNHPAGLALDADGDLYVADTGNNRVQKLAPGGRPLRVWSGGALQFRHPHDVAVSRSGIVYVADTGRNRVVALSPAGSVLSVWGHGGTAPGEFRNPTGIDVATAGYVYVVDKDNQRVQRITPATDAIKVWGKTAGPGSRGRFGHPAGIAVDQTGSVYVVDTVNSRVQKLSTTGHSIGIWGADLSLFPQVARPNYVAFDRQGDLFVSDTGNNRILKYSRDGVIVDRFGHTGSGKGEFLHPAGLAVGGDGSLYVADTGNNRVQRLSAHGHPLGTWRSSGTGHLSNPEGLAIDQEGRLYVVDRSNARIEVMNVRRRAGHPGRLTTLTLPSGWALNQPKGIAVDRRERVYVADSGNRRVLVLSGSKRMKVRGIAGPPGHRSFDPTGIAVSHAGGVYVTDTLGSCVDSADAGHLSPSHWQMICSHLHAPQGIAEDGRNHIFIADSGDSRILMLSAGTGGQYGG